MKLKKLALIITIFIFMNCSSTTKKTSINEGIKEGCIDRDGDGRGKGCPKGEDCDDNDPNNWVSCDKCKDQDGDRFYANCDRYVDIKGPDCDDNLARCFINCEDKNGNNIKDCLEFWLYSFGGDRKETGYSVVAIKDRSYFLGNTESFGKGGIDLLITKFRLNGEGVWQKSIGREGDDSGISIEAVDDKLVIGGFTNSYGFGSNDGWLLVLDQKGEIVWEEAIGGNYYEEIRDVYPYEGYIYFSGYTKSFGSKGWDGWIGKVDLSDGKVEWQLHLGTTNWDYLSCITVKDGIIYVAGYSKLDETNSDIWIVALNNNGEVIWSETVGGDNFESATDIKADDSYIYLTGFTDSVTGELRNIWVAKLSFEGELIWFKSIDSNRSYDEGRAIYVDKDGIIIGGNTRGNKQKAQDFVIIKMDKDGELLWAKTIGGRGYEELRGIWKDKDGIYVIGDTRSYGIKTQDILIGRLSSTKKNRFGKNSCSSISRIYLRVKDMEYKVKKYRVKRYKVKIKGIKGNSVITELKVKYILRCPKYHIEPIF